ncbi:hypothetical protein, partial [Helicobacter pylori]
KKKSTHNAQTLFNFP